VENRLSRLALLLRRDPKLVDFQEDRELFRILGLEKFPPPLLIKGPLSINYGGKAWNNTALRPFIGLSPDRVRTLQLTHEAPYLLTIENLASFQRHVREVDDQGVVLFTAGFPSPAMAQVLNQLDSSLGRDCPVSPEIAELRLVPLTEVADYDLFSPDVRFIEKELPRLVPSLAGTLQSECAADVAACTGASRLGKGLRA
jgi:hypothetical protein